jgi:hypothetical protein
MASLASLLRPWLTVSSSSDSESSTRLHYSSYLVTLRISSSILSGPTFPIVVFSRNLSNRFSHRGFPSRVPIDRGRVKAPVVLGGMCAFFFGLPFPSLSFHPSLTVMFNFILFLFYLDCSFHLPEGPHPPTG